MSAQSNATILNLRNILVAYDIVASSDGAVARALDLADEFGARVEIVHAIGLPALDFELVPSPVAVAGEVDALTLVRRQIVERVGKLLRRRKSKRYDAEQLVNVVAGRPASVLLERARDLQADLIVMGALRKRRGLDFGSTARAVLAKAPCAVWAQPGMPAPLRRILVPFDFSTQSKRAVATAIELASATGAGIDVLHVFDLRPYVLEGEAGIAPYESIELARADAKKNFETEMAQFEWKGLRHGFTFFEGTPVIQILEHARKADLVVMGTHGRTRLAAAFLGSVAYPVLKQVERPVLVVRDHDREPTAA